MTSEPPDELAELLSAAVGQVLRLQDSESFLRWMRQASERLPQAFPPGADAGARRAMATSLGRALWNATPLPRLGYRPEPLPKPQRNDPCPCGSGVKHKRCCAGTPTPPPLDPGFIWSLVLEQVSAAESKRMVAAGAVPRHLLGQLARRWNEEGHSARAVRLLEPLFASPAGLDERHEEALDALLDAYDALGRRAAKMAAIERLLAEVGAPLRAALWMRLATIHSDRGERQRAWECFERAQRDAPRSVSLSQLEVVLLMAEDRPERATERARFWLARLRREGYDEEEPPLPFLRDVASAPNRTMALLDSSADPRLLERFADLILRGAERPVPVYRLTTLQAPAHRLAAPAELRRLERRWRALFPLDKPFSISLEPFFVAADAWEPETARRWLGFLADEERACDSLEILDDLCLAVEQLETARSTWAAATFTAPLAERGEAILRRALADRGPVELPWVCADNRPALRLAVRNLYHLQNRDEREAATARLEWLLALNPEDNHGLREPLANAYLRAGADARLLELAARYPPDLSPQLAYGKVLALFRMERNGEALAALADAVRELPQVAAYLLARDPKPPKLSPLGFILGGKDQAWLYRQEMLEVFAATPGLLDWLRRSVPTLKRRTPRRRA